MKKHGVFTAPHDFEHLRKMADKYINQGVSMGEGWLIPAEMAALAESGTENIVCAQPFGCLPNHIVAKGMSRAIKADFPDAMATRHINVRPISRNSSGGKHLILSLAF